MTEKEVRQWVVDGECEECSNGDICCPAPCCDALESTEYEQFSWELVGTITLPDPPPPALEVYLTMGRTWREGEDGQGYWSYRPKVQLRRPE